VNEWVDIVGALTLIGVAGHQQNSEFGTFPRCRQRKRYTIHHRHADVGEQKIETAVLGNEKVERRLAVASGLDVVSCCSERPREQRAKRFLIFGYENTRHGDQRIDATTSRRLTKRRTTSCATAGGEAKRARKVIA
jgi:hypothetical protein